jgi:hypothetical protein
MTEQSIPDAAIIPARLEGVLALRWAHLAKSEGHKRSAPPSASLQEVRQENGRQGAAAALAKRAAETPAEKAAARAMFLARNHPPLTTRALQDRYGMSDSYARRTCALLLRQKRIRVVGKSAIGGKLYEAAE